jgi:heme exporter protein D
MSDYVWLAVDTTVVVIWGLVVVIGCVVVIGWVVACEALVS